MIAQDATGVGVGRTGPFPARRLAAGGASIAVVERGSTEADTRKTRKRLLAGARVTPRREVREIEMGEREIRDALERHWAASDANDFAAEHEIYRDDAVLHYPQSGERIRGRRHIQESRTVQPSEKRFAVQRILGGGDLWVTEFVLSYDGVPSYAVSIMEFSDGKVARETQYFGDPFKPGPSRAHLIDPND